MFTVRHKLYQYAAYSKLVLWKDLNTHFLHASRSSRTYVASGNACYSNHFSSLGQLHLCHGWCGWIKSKYFLFFSSSIVLIDLSDSINERKQFSSSNPFPSRIPFITYACNLWSYMIHEDLNVTRTAAVYSISITKVDGSNWPLDDIDTVIDPFPCCIN